MATLARSVASAGVKHVTGDLVYDASAFDDRKIPDGWKTTYLGAAYAARVSALSLNENVVWVVVQPAGKDGVGDARAGDDDDPRGARFGSRGDAAAASSRVAPADGGVDVSGSIGASSGPLRYSLVVDDPALFTAGALRAALQKAGITVDGAREGRQDAGERHEGRGLPSPPLRGSSRR